MKLSIVIPCCFETRLERTINRIKLLCQDDLPEIVVVYDGDRARNYCIDYPKHLLIEIENENREGTSFSRHVGTMAASHNAIFTTDGHCDWRDGQNFAARLLELVQAHPDDFLCCRMRKITKQHLYLQDSSDVSTGARLFLRVNDSAGKKVLCARWQRGADGIIPIAMGAGYAFDRRRYVERLSMPWRVNIGWGLDEITFCLANWVCGGETRMVDVEIGHPFDYRKIAPPANRAPAKTFSNRIAMLRWLPMSQETRGYLMDWIADVPFYASRKEVIESVMRHDVIDELKAAYSSEPRNFDQFIKTFNCTDRILSNDNKNTAF